MLIISISEIKNSKGHRLLYLKYITIVKSTKFGEFKQFFGLSMSGLILSQT
jgi:hypothetical protein